MITKATTTSITHPASTRFRKPTTLPLPLSLLLLAPTFSLNFLLFPSPATATPTLQGIPPPSTSPISPKTKSFDPNDDLTTTCLAPLAAADANANGIVQIDEYASFVSSLSGNDYQYDVSSFDDLPYAVKVNFLTLSCACRDIRGDGCCTGDNVGLFVSGAREGEVPTDEEERYFRRVCGDTQTSIDEAQRWEGVEESTAEAAVVWKDFSFRFYEAVGNGYCVDGAGEAYDFPSSEISIPEDEKTSIYFMSYFCGEHCVSMYSNHSGFQIRHDSTTQELLCQCLTGEGRISKAVREGSEDHYFYLQCYKYIPPDSIDDFDFVGAGTCTDDNFHQYDSLFYGNVPSSDECRRKCLDLNTTDLAGILLSSGCECLFPGDQNPFRPDGADSASYNLLGVGPVRGTDENSYVNCFSFQEGSYTDEGPGNCVDGNGVAYDSVVYMSMASLEDCQDVCTSDSTGFVGLTYDGESRCFCLYDDGTIPLQPFGDVSLASFSMDATGEIYRGNGNLQDACYSFNGFVPKVIFPIGCATFSCSSND